MYQSRKECNLHNASYVLFHIIISVPFPNIGTWILFVPSNGRLDLRALLDCNLVIALIYIPKEVSSWLIVAVSVERLLIIYYPLKAKMFCCTTWARLAVASILTAVCVINWNLFGGYKMERDRSNLQTEVCPGRTPFIDHYNRHTYGWVNSTFYSYMPSILILVLNTAIIAKAISAAKKVNVQAGDMDEIAITESRTLAKNSRKLTVMGLTLSGAFIVLTVPQAVQNLHIRAVVYRQRTDPVAYYTEWMVGQVLSSLYHLNHAINLALYCVTSASFRNDLYDMVRCRKYGRTGDSSETKKTTK